MRPLPLVANAGVPGNPAWRDWMPRLEVEILFQFSLFSGNQGRIRHAYPTARTIFITPGAILELSNQSIQDRVLKVIATSKRIPLDSVQPDSSFESLGIDSLDRLNLLFDLESEFDIEINDEEAKQVQNIREMIEGVTKLVEAKAASSPSE
jgi:acyl carrier protein